MIKPEIKYFTEEQVKISEEIKGLLAKGAFNAFHRKHCVTYLSGGKESK